MYWMDGYTYAVLANGQAAGGGQGKAGLEAFGGHGKDLAALVGAFN